VLVQVEWLMQVVSGFLPIMVLLGLQSDPQMVAIGFQWRRIQMAQKLWLLIAVVTFGPLLIQGQRGLHAEQAASCITGNP
jgi:hypothetical protein